MYYRNERAEFQEEFKRELPNWDATVIVIKKILKHYKLGTPSIYCTSGRNHSNAGKWKITINAGQMNFAVICHELAHTYQDVKGYREKGENWHNKRHKRIMKRMLDYCKKKNWFEEEINRRLAPRPVKPEPTKDELNQKLIARLEDNCKRYQTKLKLYSGKLKKTQKRIERMKKRTIKEVNSLI